MSDDKTPIYVREGDERAARRITLDSPHNRNPLSFALTDQLAEAFARAAEDATADRIRAVVLTGPGPTFCAGADLKGDPSTTPQRAARMVDLLEQVLACAVPVVVELNGNVRAGGLGILAAADIVVTSASATFAFSEMRIGVAPAVIAVTLLPTMTPHAAGAARRGMEGGQPGVAPRRGQADPREGVRAFAEKREPSWVIS